MSTNLTVSIDRSALTLPALAITGDPIMNPTASYWIPKDGISTPDLAWRLAYAADSAWVAGKQLLSAVLEASSLPLVVMVRAANPTALAARKAELEAAVSQFTYVTTITVGGVSTAWRCDPAFPQWGALTHAHENAVWARGALVIPVNPPGVVTPPSP